MCGITGILAFNEAGKKHLARVSAATYCLQKRGPDAEGIVFTENAAFGHRRLKVIDLTDNASQPMQDVSSRYTLVFNGEIFNYRELKKELEEKGVKFRSESDTETLLHLLIREGKDALHRVEGEFAFGFYDSLASELLLVRDRYGIKPLYYYQDEDRLVFASGLNALMKYGVPKLLDHASLHLYFHLNYIPAPYSIISEVKKVEPGMVLMVRNGEVEHALHYTLGPPGRLDWDADRSKKETRPVT
jgi:asparagine synthase (glutamine-hydrolysing)